MYKKMLYLLLAGFFCLGVYGNAFADVSFTWTEPDYFYMTNEATGKGEHQYTFSPVETPWLHLSINKTYFGNVLPDLFEIQLLFHEDSLIPIHQAFGYTGSDGFGSWVGDSSYQLSRSLNDWGWNSSLIGNWKLNWSAFSKTHQVSASANLYATPEPISCVLFLLGGGSLAFSRFRKRFA